MPLSAPASLRLRRACTVAAVVLVLLPYLAILAMGALGIDPTARMLAIAQAYGGSEGGVFARALEATTGFVVQWWFLLLRATSITGTLLMLGVALTERRLAVPLRIGWGVLFVGLFIALSPYLSAASMLLFAWLFLRRPRTGDNDGEGAADGVATAPESSARIDSSGD